jgi:hypothetical protein
MKLVIAEQCGPLTIYHVFHSETSAFQFMERLGEIYD